MPCWGLLTGESEGVRAAEPLLSELRPPAARAPQLSRRHGDARQGGEGPGAWKTTPLGVLLGGFGRQIDGPGLPGGKILLEKQRRPWFIRWFQVSIICQGHLLPPKGTHGNDQTFGPGSWLLFEHWFTQSWYLFTGKYDRSLFKKWWLAKVVFEQPSAICRFPRASLAVWFLGLVASFVHTKQTRLVLVERGPNGVCSSQSFPAPQDTAQASKTLKSRQVAALKSYPWVQPRL